MKEWLDSLRPIWKYLILGTFGFVMFIATIKGAMAASFEPAEKYVLGPGASVDGQFVLYDIPFGVEPIIGINGPFITIIDETRQGDLLILDYTIDIPKNTPIDRYYVTFATEIGEELVEAEMIIDIQGKAFVAFNKLFKQYVFRMILFFGFLIAILVALIVSYTRRVRRGFHKKNYVMLAIIVSLFIGIIVLFTQTNMIVKHPGAEFTQQVKISETKVYLGSMSIVRNEATPIAADWVTFNVTGDPFIFYSVRSNDERTFTLNIDIPTTVNPGVYKYDIKVAYLGEEPRIITKKFRVA